jgi:hypothetical protein
MKYSSNDQLNEKEKMLHQLNCIISYTFGAYDTSPNDVITRIKDDLTRHASFLHRVINNYDFNKEDLALKKKLASDLVDLIHLVAAVDIDISKRDYIISLIETICCTNDLGYRWKT